jgi:hypothetical protein
MKPIITTFALALGLSVGGHAQAQNAQPAPNTDASGSGNLSDKLDQSGGVIHPKDNVDPGITKPAPVPNPNSTTVIVPPGTDGAPGAKAK